MRFSRPARFLKRYLTFLVPLLVISAVVVVALHRQETGAALTVAKAKEQLNVELQVEQVEYDLAAVVSDLMTLASQHAMRAFAERDVESLGFLAQDCLALSEQTGLYDQIRVLDALGMERVRINYNEGAPYVVPESELQNKWKRYYFADALALGEGEIFISPLDLNIERGEIELPLKPMIRIGTPVFDDHGRKHGIVLLNYFGARILGRFERRALGSLGANMLLNADGYWLKGAEPEDEWGFMYPGRKEVRIQRRFPAEWEKIGRESSGQFMSANGLFTFATVRPWRADRRSSTAGEARASAVGSIAGGDYRWTVVSRVTPENLAALTATSRRTLGLIFAIGLMVLPLISGLVTHARMKCDLAREAAAARTAELEQRTVELEKSRRRSTEYWGPEIDFPKDFGGRAPLPYRGSLPAARRG